MPQWFDDSIQENILKDKSPSTEALQWSGELCLPRDMHNSCYQVLISKQFSVLPFRESGF